MYSMQMYLNATTLAVLPLEHSIVPLHSFDIIKELKTYLKVASCYYKALNVTDLTKLQYVFFKALAA